MAKGIETYITNTVATKITVTTIDYIFCDNNLFCGKSIWWDIKKLLVWITNIFSTPSLLLSKTYFHEGCLYQIVLRNIILFELSFHSEKVNSSRIGHRINLRKFKWMKMKNRNQGNTVQLSRSFVLHCWFR